MDDTRSTEEVAESVIRMIVNIESFADVTTRERTMCHLVSISVRALIAFRRSVASMRSAQREFFTTQSGDSLVAVKRYEEEVDRLLEDL